MTTLSMIEKMRVDLAAWDRAGMITRENVMEVAHTTARFYAAFDKESKTSYKAFFAYAMKALYNVIKVVEAGAQEDLNVVMNQFSYVSKDGKLQHRKSTYDTICIMGDYLKIIKGDYTEKAFIAARTLCENCGLYLAQNI